MLMQPSCILYVGIRLNGVTFIVMDNNSVSIDLTLYLNPTRVYELVAGDYIEAMLYHANGVATDTPVLGNYSPEFEMQRIG